MSYDPEKMREISEGIINAAGGKLTDKNIDGVFKILDTMYQEINNNWEQFLTENTNEALAIDNFCCACCGTLIQIIRERLKIYADVC
jgi:hypothetical protein